MNIPLLLGCALAYLWVAVNYTRQRQFGMALAFASYALANVGFAITAWRGR